MHYGVADVVAMGHFGLAMQFHPLPPREVEKGVVLGFLGPQSKGHVVTEEFVFRIACEGRQWGEVDGETPPVSRWHPYNALGEEIDAVALDVVLEWLE